MNVLLELELEGLPPTVNQMYRGLKGHRYKRRECVEYQSYVSGLMREVWGSREAYDGSVSLSVRFVVKGRRKWDMDNRLKALQDCLMSGGVIRDDSQIEELYVKRERGEKTGTYLTLKTLES